MSDIIYVKMIGEKQGDISAGCGTYNSVGNHYQKGHEDEIFAYCLSNGISSTGAGMNLQQLALVKLVDKSSPLLATAITNNEKLHLEVSLYRVNRYGMWDKYYSIELRGASLKGITSQFMQNALHTETITVSYDYIRCKHPIANTEFDYLALPADYNSLFVPKRAPVAAPTTTTINSKAAGRLLAAGGVYNGNIEGFKKTAEQLGGEAKAGYDQVLNQRTVGVAIAAVSMAAAVGLSGLSPVSEISTLSKLNPELHVLGEVTGEYSAVNPGPLGDLAKTFAGGSYKAIILSEETSFFRAGVNGSPFGQFLSYEQPLGVIQTRIDKALLPVWPNGAASPIDTKFEIRIPAGNTVYIGETGYQNGFYQGGTDQVVAIEPWDIPGVQVFNKGVLK